MKPRIYLGWDAREAIGAEVCRWSIERHSSIPVDIRFLNHEDLARRGFSPDASRGGATAFSYSRFLIPWLCDYDGPALFLDGADMLVLGDIAEVFALPMDGLAIRCTQPKFTPTTATKFLGERQIPYRRKLWSSFFLMDCARLRCWSKEMVERGPGARLHQFMDVPDERVGAIPPEWNETDRIKPETKCFHWTEFSPCNAPLNAREVGIWMDAWLRMTESGPYRRAL